EDILHREEPTMTRRNGTAKTLRAFALLAGALAAAAAWAQNIDVKGTSTHEGNAYFNQNVGIGTTGPVGPLDAYVSGGHRLLLHSAHTFLTAPATGNIHLANNLSWNGSTWTTYDSTQPQSVVWLGGGAIDLYTGPASTTWAVTSRLHVSNNGNVGIGTA